MNCQSYLYRGLERKLITRRWFFEQCGVGLGAIALGSLFRQNGWASPGSLANPLAPKQPHFPAKAKRVIFLFMAGRRVISNFSITNPSWPSGTAKSHRLN